MDEVRQIDDFLNNDRNGVAAMVIDDVDDPPAPVPVVDLNPPNPRPVERAPGAPDPQQAGVGAVPGAALPAVPAPILPVFQVNPGAAAINGEGDRPGVIIQEIPAVPGAGPRGNNAQNMINQPYRGYNAPGAVLAHAGGGGGNNPQHQNHRINNRYRGTRAGLGIQHRRRARDYARFLLYLAQSAYELENEQD